MLIKNPVKKIICNHCGCREAELLVCTENDDCLSINSSGIMRNGMDIIIDIANKEIKQENEDGGYCEGCDCEWCGVTVLFEDGTIINSNDQNKDVISYWLAHEWETLYIRHTYTFNVLNINNISITTN